MKKLLTVVVAAGLAVCVGLWAGEKGPQPTTAKAATPSKSAATGPASRRARAAIGWSKKERLGYCIGVDIGTMLKRQEVRESDLDAKAFMQGFRDGLAGTRPRMLPVEIGELMNEFKMKLRGRHQDKQGQRPQGPIYEKGQTFLAANGKKEGVKVLPSGLQYKVIRPATGVKPKAADTVTVHYRGTLIDGTQFDSSYDRGKPATFRVTGVIPGWTEALQLMAEGAKWQLFIPSNLAYGQRGTRERIPPNSVLIFDVELIKVGRPTETKAKPTGGE